MSCYGVAYSAYTHLIFCRIYCLTILLLQHYRCSTLVSVKNVFEEPVDVTLKITVTPEAVGLVEFEAQLKPAYGLVQVTLKHNTTYKCQLRSSAAHNH
jgi:hypothetical protein